MRRTHSTHFAVAAAAALTLAAGCSSSTTTPTGAGGGTTAPATTAASAPTSSPAGGTITIKNFQFSSLTAKPGETITVTNQDQAAHTLTADDKSFDTHSIDGGASKTITAPSKPGTYTFYCAIHTSMKGTLTVS